MILLSHKRQSAILNLHALTKLKRTIAQPLNLSPQNTLSLTLNLTAAVSFDSFNFLTPRFYW
jgi:hypothetical protein